MIRDTRWVAIGVALVLAAAFSAAAYNDRPTVDTEGDGVAAALDRRAGAPPTLDLVDGTGYSVCPCNETRTGSAWPSHGAYVACVVVEAKQRRAAALMTVPESRAAILNAKRSTCGRSRLPRLAGSAGELGPSRTMTVRREALDKSRQAEAAPDSGRGHPTAHDPSARRVEYRDDRLTVYAHHVPLADVVNEVGRKSGAEIRGQVCKQHDVSEEFDAVPLPEALERLLGEQNFTLRYGAGNRLEAVDLLSEPGPLTSSSASSTDPTSAGSALSRVPRAVVDGSGVPAGGQGARVPGLSVSVLGATSSSDQAGARGSSVMLGGGGQTTAQGQQSSNDNQQMSDAELQQRIRRSLLNSLNSMDDASLAAFIDTPEGRRVQALVQYYADHHQGSTQQQKAAGIIQRLPNPPAAPPHAGR